MRRLPPLNSLRAFEAAARLRSVSLAARELGVTHGAISRQVRLLEKFLGARLFMPSGRGLEPTDAGLRFSAEVGGALDRVASATERLIEPSAARIIRINALPTFTFHWLFPRLGSFQKLHPSAEPRLSASTQQLKDIGATYDVFIRRRPMVREGYRCVRFLEDFGTPVCTPELLQEKPIRQPSDLSKHTVLFSDTHPGLWEDWMAGARISKPRKTVRFEHFHVLLQAALEGLGVALGSAVLVEEELRTGRLVVALDQPRTPFRPFYLLYRTEGPNRERVKTFANWLLAEAASFQDELAMTRDRPAPSTRVSVKPQRVAASRKAVRKTHTSSMKTG